MRIFRYSQKTILFWNSHVGLIEVQRGIFNIKSLVLVIRHDTILIAPQSIGCTFDIFFNFVNFEINDVDTSIEQKPSMPLKQIIIWF